MHTKGVIHCTLLARTLNVWISVTAGTTPFFSATVRRADRAIKLCYVARNSLTSKTPPNCDVVIRRKRSKEDTTCTVPFMKSTFKQLRHTTSCGLVLEVTCLLGGKALVVRNKVQTKHTRASNFEKNLMIEEIK